MASCVESAKLILDVVSGTSVFPCFFIYGEVCSFQQCVPSLHIFDICQASCIGKFRLAIPLA